MPSPDGEGVILVLDRRSEDQADRLTRLAQGSRRSPAPGPLHRDQGWWCWPRHDRHVPDDGFGRGTSGWAASLRAVDDRDGDVVASRVVLVPEMLRQAGDVLLNLIRHEFDPRGDRRRDHRLPLWIVEGLAEWASWRADPTSQIATVGGAEAEEDGGVTRMPPDGDFRSAGPGTATAIAWFAMRWLETNHGGEAPYDLLADAAAKRAFGPGSRGCSSATTTSPPTSSPRRAGDLMLRPSRRPATRRPRMRATRRNP